MGVTDAMIRTQLRSGALMSVRRGVYLSSAAWPDDPAVRHLVRAQAELVANPEAVLSHQSAALAWGLPFPGFGAWHDEKIAVTLPRGHTSFSGRTVHHVVPLPVGEIIRDPAGYTVTSPSRTAVDLADGRDVPEALVLLDAAARLSCAGFVPVVRRRDYVNPRLVDAARELLRSAARTRGIKRLDSVISMVEPCRESPAESLSAGHFHLGGIPAPQFQAELRTARGTFFPDCFWEEQGLIGECDGAGKYKDAQEIMREKGREQILRDLGHPFVRWSAKEIMTTPWVVIDRVARELNL